MSLFEDILKHVQNTNEQYLSLYRSNIKTYPIPYFGNISDAEVITLGVNPSPEEFAEGREWRQNCDSSYLKNRLLNYFHCTVPPHPFFYKWEDCLQILGYSYFSNAAHIDLSPRPTKSISSMRDKEERKLFIDMIRQDIQFLKDLLHQCTNIKLILTAGAVTKEYWTYECLKNNFSTTSLGMNLNGDTRRGVGSPWSKMLELESSSRRIPLFFTSTGPAARNNQHYLMQQVGEWRAMILAKVNYCDNDIYKMGLIK